MPEVQIAGTGTQINLAVPGIQGPAGAISSGGSANQVFYKVSGTNYDAGWTFIGNANVDAAAAIAGTKISPNFGSQATVTTGTNTAASFIPTSATIPSNGIYLPGANQVGVATNGTEKLIVLSNGNVGIGTGSPATQLDVSGNGLIKISNGTQSGWFGATSTAFGFWGSGVNPYPALTIGTTSNHPITIGTNNIGRLIVDTSGNVGIGTSSPATALNVQASAGEIVRATVSSNTGLYANIGADGNGGWFGSNAGLSFRPSGTERALIDTSGRLLVGTSSVRNAGTASQTTRSPLYFIEGAGANAYSLFTGILGRADSNGPNITLAKTRSNSTGDNTIVQNNDVLGQFFFAGADGTDLNSIGASIQAEVDGTPGVDDMPGRLVFSTTPDNQSPFTGPVERMRINEKGALKATTNSGTYVSSTGVFHELIGNHTGESTVILKNFNGSYDRPVVQIDCVRAANSAYSHLQAYSGGFDDTEFNLRGDGNAFADGTFTGGGADYAEYFEWSDGNPSEEDRRGISVVLDGDKIRKAVAGEDPIGVISGNPSIVGDAAWNKWSGKYLRDEFGTYLLDANGDRQLNPAFDPDAEYIPREQRPEWDCVGLMGKLRIRKGQVTGSRWIKMRDISDSVEEWLVR